MSDMTEWYPKMSEYFQAEMEHGEAHLVPFEVSKSDSDFSKLRACNPNDRNAYVPEGRYIKLLVDGVLMMSDTPMEQDTMRPFLDNACGDVLIGGLGLGIATLCAERNQYVKSITVIEKSEDVIRLIAKHVPFATTTRFIHGSVFDLHTDDHYDTIYMDIWPNICTDNLDGMTKLRKMYLPLLKKRGWFGCWEEDELHWCASCGDVPGWCNFVEADDGEEVCENCLDSYNEDMYEEEEDDA